MNSVYSVDRAADQRHVALMLGILTVPFLLNDFANIFVKDYRVWLAIDYVFVKAFPLAVIAYLLRTKKISPSDLGIRSIAFGPFAKPSNGVFALDCGFRAYPLVAWNQCHRPYGGY